MAFFLLGKILKKRRQNRQKNNLYISTNYDNNIGYT